MITQVHPENPQSRVMAQIVGCLEKNGVIIVPTDSVYALVCDMNSQNAVDKICRLRNLNPVKANLTFLCESISRISSFTAPIDNSHYRLIKRNTPGPFTFILRSNNSVPKFFKNKKKTIGARIPDHILLQQLIEQLGRPLMSATLKDEENPIQYQLIEEIDYAWSSRVDMVIESGIVPGTETAIIDLTTADVEVVREGQAELIL